MTGALNTEKLGKLLALASSDNDAEALAALRRAKSLLQASGTDFVALAAQIRPAPVYSAPPAWSPPPEPEPYRAADGSTWKSKAEYERYMAQQEAQFEADRRKYAAERAAIIARYGSAEKAAARDAREQALHDAVAEWLEPQDCDPPGRWSRSLDGWKEYTGLDKASPRAVAAVKRALPLPQTIGAAIEEVGYWRTRDREIVLAIEDYGFNGGLDLPALLREDVVIDLLRRTLRPSDMGELIDRLAWIESQNDGFLAHEILPDLITDLKRLAAAAPRRKKTAADRQYEMWRDAGCPTT